MKLFFVRLFSLLLFSLSPTHSLEFPLHSIVYSALAAQKWGLEVPILARIIDSEGSDKLLGDCVVFGTLFKEMNLRSSVRFFFSLSLIFPPLSSYFSPLSVIVPSSLPRITHFSYNLSPILLVFFSSLSRSTHFSYTLFPSHVS